MKRLLAVAALLLCASQAHAGGPYRPGDNPELNAWYAKWMTTNYILVLPYDPTVFNSYVASERACRQDLTAIANAYPGTPAAEEARGIDQFLGLLPRIGVPIVP